MRRHRRQRLVAGHGAGDDDLFARVLHGGGPPDFTLASTAGACPRLDRG
jgi:hypothetical protein